MRKEEIYAGVGRMFASGRVPHAMLLISDELDAARDIAASIVCRRKTFPACGGCMYQTMDYTRQLSMKAAQVKELLDQAKPYAVSLYQYQQDLLERRHGLKPYLDGAVLVLNPEFYSKETGLTLEPGGFEFQEV